MRGAASRQTRAQTPALARGAGRMAIAMGAALTSADLAAAQEEDARRPWCSDHLLGFGLADTRRVIPIRQRARSATRAVESARRTAVHDDESPSTDLASCRNAFRCAGCGATDANLLEKNGDSAYACSKCGTVDAQATVSGDRQKFCARADDRTVVGDAAADDDAALSAAIGAGETRGQKRRRLLDAAGDGGASAV